MSLSGLYNNLRDKLTPRYKRAMDDGRVLLVGVFRRGNAAFIGLIVRNKKGREYVRVFEKWNGVAWTPIVLAGGEPFDWRDWCDEGHSPVAKACHRARRAAIARDARNAARAAEDLVRRGAAGAERSDVAGRVGWVRGRRTPDDLLCPDPRRAHRAEPAEPSD